MNYLLGGPPRIGKSIIAGAIAVRRGVSVVSTDSLGAILESISSPEADPGLFCVARFNELPAARRLKVMKEDTAHRIDLQMQESQAVWRTVEPYIRREQEERRHLAIEGVAILPGLVSELRGVDYRAVFIGNQSTEHAKNIRASAERRLHDWIRQEADDYIEAFATFVVEMSRVIEAEAREHGFAYVEMARMPFDRVGGVVESLWFDAPRRP